MSRLLPPPTAVAAAAKASFESTTRFGKLNSVRVTVAGRYAYARFACATGDAMGMNMVSKGVNAVLEWLQQGSERFPDMEVLGLSGNLCCDKKPAAVNWIEGRGCSVVVEATIPGQIVQDVLKTTVEAAVRAQRPVLSVPSYLLPVAHAP